jgi:hypothetical protein
VAAGLDDPQSVERGIGSDCWRGVLAIITSAREAERGARDRFDG